MFDIGENETKAIQCKFTETFCVFTQRNGRTEFSMCNKKVKVEMPTASEFVNLKLFFVTVQRACVTTIYNLLHVCFSWLAPCHLI